MGFSTIHWSIPVIIYCLTSFLCATTRQLFCDWNRKHQATALSHIRLTFTSTKKLIQCKLINKFNIPDLSRYWTDLNEILFGFTKQNASHESNLSSDWTPHTREILSILNGLWNVCAFPAMIIIQMKVKVYLATPTNRRIVVRYRKYRAPAERSSDEYVFCPKSFRTVYVNETQRQPTRVYVFAN